MYKTRTLRDKFSVLNNIKESIFCKLDIPILCLTNMLKGKDKAGEAFKRVIHCLLGNKRYDKYLQLVTVLLYDP